MRSSMVDGTPDAGSRGADVELRSRAARGSHSLARGCSPRRWAGKRERARAVEIVLAIATILGGLTALWFFWDKVSAWFSGRDGAADSIAVSLAANPSRDNILGVILKSARDPTGIAAPPEPAP